jgi:hypothetical protein
MHPELLAAVAVIMMTYYLLINLPDVIPPDPDETCGDWEQIGCQGGCQGGQEKRNCTRKNGSKYEQKRCVKGTGCISYQWPINVPGLLTNASLSGYIFGVFGSMLTQEGNEDNNTVMLSGSGLLYSHNQDKVLLIGANVDAGIVMMTMPWSSFDPKTFTFHGDFTWEYDIVTGFLTNPQGILTYTKREGGDTEPVLYEVGLKPLNSVRGLEDVWIFVPLSSS